jgi:hypothetical protein
MESEKQKFFTLTRIPRNAEESSQKMRSYIEFTASALNLLHTADKAIIDFTLEGILTHGRLAFEGHIANQQHALYPQHQALRKKQDRAQQLYIQRKIMSDYELINIMFCESAIKKEFTEDEIKEILWTKWKNRPLWDECVEQFQIQMTNYLKDERSKIESGERVSSATQMCAVMANL